MTSLVFATNNLHKVDEVKDKLGDSFSIQTLQDIGCNDDVPETSDTLEGNAMQKARYLYDKYGCDCFADDTGLEVEALDNAPGVYSARYAGEAKNPDANMEKLLNELAGQTNRKARFRTVIALILGGEEYMFEGVVSGDILEKKQGNEGFGYDPLFLPDGYEKSFAQLSMAEKNAISHRGRAVEKLLAFLKETKNFTMNIGLKIVLILLFSSSFLISHAQMAMGAWKTHFSYNNVKEIAELPEKVYAISNGSLFSVDKKYESIETYSKINGLSDGEIAHIAGSRENNLLLVAYSNGNIDLLKGDKIINISDLKRKEITGKEINSIFFHKHYAYLSCGFGIMVVDVRKNEISDTYIIWKEGVSIKIKSVAIAGNYIYALTGSGIYYADIQSKNLSNYENWKLLPPAPAGDASEYKDIAVFNDELVLLRNNSVCRYDGKAWSVFLENVYFAALGVVGENLLFFQENSFVRFDKNLNKKESRELSGIVYMIFSPYENCYWIAQYDKEEVQTVLIKYKNGAIENKFIPEGPYSSRVYSVKHRYGKLITCSGGPFDIRPIGVPGVVQIYENNRWTIIRDKDIPAEALDKSIVFTDVLDVEIDPRNHNQMYVATWRKSLFLFDNYKLINHFTTDNSTLGRVPSGENYFPQAHEVILDGLCFDKDNNLWMANMQSPNVINVKKADNSWQSFFYPKITNKETVKFFIAKNGYKWLIGLRAGVGIFVIDDRGTPFEVADDRTQWLDKYMESNSSEAKILQPNSYRCITEDKNNVIWVGTDMGPLIISNPENIFSENFTVDRIKITRDDDESLADYLLDTELVNAIAIDGGNRKWIGTESSGAFLLSPNGQETIQHFTTENSPLTSNAIVSLSVNDETGEVFIATSNALYSYKSDATTGAPSYSGVYAYPNPVRANYTGVITVAGLMENSIVKIADITGNLIHQGYSNGGVFTWNVRNLRGERVGSGIYLVFAALQDGSEKTVTKIAIIN